MSYGRIVTKIVYFKDGSVLSKEIKNKDSGDYDYNKYHKNGELHSVGVKASWPQEAKIGEWIYYHNNGELYKTELYSDYGGLQEVINCFDGKGNSLNKGNFINGNGKLNSYDINGKLIKIDIYKDGSVVKE